MSEKQIDNLIVSFLIILSILLGQCMGYYYGRHLTKAAALQEARDKVDEELRNPVDLFEDH